jgi:uracil-DNA glycosylase
MNSDALRQRIQQTTALAHAICRALQEQAMGLGYSAADVVIGDPDQAVYRLSRDPASGEDSLLGEWRDDGGQKLGELIFHADGSFYAEYDVIRTHPHDDRLFVEAVNAWGRDGQIRAEPRLLPMVL